ncbi:hypothetical protein [Aliikangiella maris]|uniref:Uncharacterized protein n=2 Tax=Aliikangiella maris TaxID=3162458 RepID=A0ABV3MN84_9GAMM
MSNFVQLFVKNLVDSAIERATTNFYDNVDLFCNKLYAFGEFRVFVSASPGRGHQASTVNFMMRLMEKILVVTKKPIANVIVTYDPGTQGNLTVDKLAVLIPGFNPSKPTDPVTINGTKISFIALKPATNGFQKISLAKTSFGISGGTDQGSINYAYPLNVSQFLMVQPFQWPTTNGIWSFPADESKPNDLVNLESFLESTNPLVDGLTFCALRGLYTNFPQVNDAFWESFSQSPQKASLDTYRNILTLISANKCNFSPFYGISTNDIAAFSLNILFNYITSLFIAKELNPENSRLKLPVVIAVMDNPTNVSYQKLESYFSGEDTTTFNETQNAFIKKHLTGKVVIADITNFTTEYAKISAQGGCLILKMGSLPVDAFNYFYSIASIPSILEGKGTLNYAINVGTPYLQMNTASGAKKPINFRGKGKEKKLFSTPIYPNFPLTTDKILVEQSSFMWSCTNSLKTDIKTMIDGQAKVLGDMIELMVQTINGNTPLTDYFTQLSLFFHDEVNDKAFRAMAYTFIKHFPASMDIDSHLLEKASHDN